MPNFITSWISSVMAPSEHDEIRSHDHIIKASVNAKFSLDDASLPNIRRKGYHQQDIYTAPEGDPEIPRQYMTGVHASYGDFDMYAANSYKAAIAVTKMIGKREL